MRKNLYPLAILLALFLGACQSTNNSEEINTDLINNPSTANGEVNTENVPVVTFKEEVYEFGQIVQGEKVAHSFEFTNTGKSNLIIASATGSCGCTVPSWPKEPIAPGENSKINVIFDSNGKQGKQTKTITIVANTVPNKTVIALKGEVLVPDNQ